MKNHGQLICLKFLLLLGALLQASCASSDEESSTKTYSTESNAKFKNLENSPTDINELYEKSYKQNYTKSDSTQSSTSETKVKDVSLVGPAAIRRELNQVLTFHCMKHRKRFSSDNECPERVNRIIDICEKNFTSVSPDFVRCLKTKLKEI